VKASKAVVVARRLVKMDSEHVSPKRIDSRIVPVAVDRWKAVFKETKKDTDPGTVVAMQEPRRAGRA
jgi:hypothetical protein